jgi:hypothetical protein
MSPIRCPFCGKSSAADARFCSECGGALHLVPCPACDAVNDVSAASCFQCGRELAARATEPVELGPVAASPASAERNRRPAWMVAAVALLGATGALGYLALTSRTEVAAPAVPAAADVRPSEPKPRQSDEGTITPVLSERPAAAPSLAVPAPVDRKAVESIRPPAPRATVRTPQTAGRVPRSAQGDSNAACTPQAAALGLCTADAPQSDRVEPAPAPPAVVPQSDEGCMEEAAALGLCEPTAAQRGN